MLNIYFVRHGQTEWNLIRKLQGALNSPLTTEGIEQTKLLKEKIDHIKFDKCYSSPQGRAFDTAKLLLEDKLEIEIIEALAEMGFGDVEGLEKENFKEKYPTEFYNLWHEAHHYDPSAFHGETFENALDRSIMSLEEIVSRNSSGNILVVGHGMILKLIFGHIWNHDLEKFWEDPVPQNTSITHVIYENGKFIMKDFSNTSHLKNDEAISYV